MVMKLFQSIKMRGSEISSFQEECIKFQKRVQGAPYPAQTSTLVVSAEGGNPDLCPIFAEIIRIYFDQYYFINALSAGFSLLWHLPLPNIYLYKYGIFRQHNVIYGTEEIAFKEQISENVKTIDIIDCRDSALLKERGVPHTEFNKQIFTTYSADSLAERGLIKAENILDIHMRKQSEVN